MEDTRILIEKYNTLALKIFKNTKIENSTKWDMLQELRNLGDEISNIMESKGE